MSLETHYLGLNLRTPLVPSASPLSEDLGNIKLMEDSGAAAVVLYSLFEEQLSAERLEIERQMTAHKDSFSEAASFFPEPGEYLRDPDGYLEQIRRAKEAIKIPVIASLNGASMGGWTSFAKKIEEAGADALELNIYNIPADPDKKPAEIENEYIEILKSVKQYVKIPVSVKLSPFFTNTAFIAKKMDQAGADGLILFNRFYQPDIELESLEVRSDIILSSAHSLRLPLRWLGILYGRVEADLAATSGVHCAEDVVKLLMVGASITQLCSVLLRRGIPYIKTIEQDLMNWMHEHEYQSAEQMRGSMSQIKCENPSAFERAQYIRSLQSYKYPGNKKS